MKAGLRNRSIHVDVISKYDIAEHMPGHDIKRPNIRTNQNIYFLVQGE